MKKVVVIIALCVVSAVAIAQNGIINYGIMLAEPGEVRGARSIVHLDKVSKSVLSQPVNSETINGFRICVFFDNSQTARQSAASSLSMLRTRFPKLKSEQTYTNPVWKVFAGEFITRAEATLALSTLKTYFPKAFIVTEKLPISRFSERLSYKIDETPIVDTEPE